MEMFVLFCVMGLAGAEPQCREITAAPLEDISLPSRCQVAATEWAEEILIHKPGARIQRWGCRKRQFGL